jgi:Fe-S cluster biogenesis protein NfuA
VDDRAAQDLVRRVDDLLEEIESLPQAGACTEVVEALVTLYGEALARMVDAAGAEARAAFAADDLVAHLLLAHDVHPVPVEERVRAAVTLAGGGAELLSVDGGVVRLRATPGSCASCGTTAATKGQAIEEAVRAAAPEVDRVEIIDVSTPTMVLPQIHVQSPGAATA